MHSRLRTAVIVALASAMTVLLTVVSALTAAVTLAATALVVPGTGTPNANVVAGYLDNVRDYYLRGTPCTAATDCSPRGIDYPASFFPLAFVPGWCRSGPDGCDQWDVSVGKGVAGLATELAPLLDPTSTEDVVIFGYSQGGAVVAKVFSQLGGQPQSVKDRLQVITIGGIENPDGGLWQRLAFLRYLPVLDVTFGPAMPTDTGIRSTAIAFQYDAVTDAPRYWGNTLALVNAFAALEVVHGFYLSPNGNDPTATLPYGYTPPGPDGEGTLLPQLDCARSPANCRYGSSGTTTYITIPATSLPIFTFLDSFVPVALRPLTAPVITLLTPVTKVLIDLAFDRTGDPDVPTPLSILPFDLDQDYVALAQRIVAAIAQGIDDVFAPAVVPAPATTPVIAAATARVAAAGPGPEPEAAPRAQTPMPVAPEATTPDDTTPDDTTPDDTVTDGTTTDATSTDSTATEGTATESAAGGGTTGEEDVADPTAAEGTPDAPDAPGVTGGGAVGDEAATEDGMSDATAGDAPAEVGSRPAGRAGASDPGAAETGPSDTGPSDTNSPDTRNSDTGSGTSAAA